MASSRQLQWKPKKGEKKKIVFLGFKNASPYLIWNRIKQLLVSLLSHYEHWKIQGIINLANDCFIWSKTDKTAGHDTL